MFKKLGAEVIELYTEMDGHFPNHHPDPTLPEALKIWWPKSKKLEQKPDWPMTAMPTGWEQWMSRAR